MTQRSYIHYSNCTASSPLDCHSIKTKQSLNKNQIVANEDRDLLHSVINNDWLPFAAEQYNISSDIKDYVIIPVIIMPSDLPNRNGVAFPYTELTRFNYETGQLAYQTWKGKPTFVEHNNQDHTKAKGVIFETAFRPIKGATGNPWKAITLIGFDRSRDPDLVNSILKGDRDSYSMGAYVQDYQCSICGALQSENPCEHVELGNPEFKTFQTKEGEKLAYLEAIDPLGFEVSSVGTPAFTSAENNHLLSISNFT